MVPALPTDNLYKFLALSGLFLIAFSFVKPFQFYKESVAHEREAQKLLSLSNINGQRERALSDITERELHTKEVLLKMERDETKKALQALEPERMRLAGALKDARERLALATMSGKTSAAEVAKLAQDEAVQYAETLRFTDSSKGVTAKEYALNAEVLLLNEKRTAQLHDLKALLVEQKFLNQTQDSDEFEAQVWNFISYSMLIAGAVLVVVGFSCWWFRLQVYQDAILAKKASSLNNASTEAEPGSY